MKNLNISVETEAISSGNSMEEIYNKPELEPDPANNLPESPRLGEPRALQPAEADDVTEPRAAGDVPESTNAERKSFTDDGEVMPDQIRLRATIPGNPACRRYSAGGWRRRRTTPPCQRQPYETVQAYLNR